MLASNRRQVADMQGMALQVMRIANLAERYAPSPQWFVVTIIEVGGHEGGSLDRTSEHCCMTYPCQAAVMPSQVLEVGGWQADAQLAHSVLRLLAEQVRGGCFAVRMLLVLCC